MVTATTTKKTGKATSQKSEVKTDDKAAKAVIDKAAKGAEMAFVDPKTINLMLDVRDKASVESDTISSEFKALVADIKANGLMNAPSVIRIKQKDGYLYQIEDGRRRVRAAIAANLPVIPVQIKATAEGTTADSIKLRALAGNAFTKQMTRTEIIKALDAAEAKGMNVKNIKNALGLPKSTQMLMKQISKLLSPIQDEELRNTLVDHLPVPFLTELAKTPEKVKELEHNEEVKEAAKALQNEAKTSGTVSGKAGRNSSPAKQKLAQAAQSSTGVTTRKPASKAETSNKPGKKDGAIIASVLEAIEKKLKVYHMQVSKAKAEGDEIIEAQSRGCIAGLGYVKGLLISAERGGLQEATK